jgi:hypothetical protein
MNNRGVTEGVFKTQRGAIVQYPGVALDDHMSKWWVDYNLLHKRFPPGTVIKMGGVVTVVKAERMEG